jgi:hypothetical protein
VTLPANWAILWKTQPKEVNRMNTASGKRPLNKFMIALGAIAALALLGYGMALAVWPTQTPALAPNTSTTSQEVREYAVDTQNLDVSGPTVETASPAHSWHCNLTIPSHDVRAYPVYTTEECKPPSTFIRTH